MKVIDRSIRGDYRELNEDVTGIFENGTGQILMLVADGMGGHRYGDVASRYVHDEIKAAWTETNLFNVEDGVEFLRRLVMDVNRRMYDYQQDHPEYQGMGTTLVLCAIIDEAIIILNVGDSRAYAMNERGIEQVTSDHSFVNLLVDAGEITAEEAKHHPKRNIITKALGTDRLIQADVFRLRNRQYDYLLLASDGLTDNLDNSELHAIIIREGTAMPDKAAQLMERAQKSGSTDNISLVLADLKASGSD
ncbi:Stp1/IreP family PP2C-type Ser/Thr phosphatase [Salinicoccus hispanicus]|uniref:Stp1/IreP family PP2C-type Ser/Thr phosphatase n=1 Tax=Salinicoccus hispanicus TaxID=157225 RepID=A0A6N8U0J2_9STAP|nr:Stp1/IreP family PP2C-type Ser/Thr phosphatase [Salinicoccus hispanicus]MXQ49835.1 Stp1/IreP family PP2C-type Ser/Thr phosphatase [Salinicoccus hispanicus]